MPRLSIVLACAALAAWDTARLPSTLAPDSERTIGRRVRLGWDQQAANASELETLRYAAYIDGARFELTGVSCKASRSAAGFPCAGDLPALAAGQHSLQLAAFLANEGALESERSASLTLNVLPATIPTPSRQSDWSNRSLVTADGVMLRLELVAGDMDRVNGLAIAADGALIVAEQGGALCVVRNGILTRDPSPIDDLFERAGGLLAVARHPQFERTRLVYVAYTARSRDGVSVLRLSRLREVAGTFGDRIVLFEQPLGAASPVAALKFADDGTLYLGIGQNILRLNSDGTTPDDQAGWTPTYATGFESTRGFDWQPQSGYLWVADLVAPAANRLSALDSDASAKNRARPVAVRVLPQWMVPSSVAFYPSGVIPSFAHDLFVASDDARVLLRIRFAANDSTAIRSTERLLENQIGGIRAVAIAPDGTIYLATAQSVARLVAASRG